MASIPEGRFAVVPYLCATDAPAALDFYVSVLGAVESGMRYTGEDGRIGHAELEFSGQTVYLSSEYPEIGVQSPTTLGGPTSAIVLVVDDVDAVTAAAAEAGAEVLKAPTQEDYGDRSATIRDPFGHRWMLNTPVEDVSEEEQRRRATADGWT